MYEKNIKLLYLLGGLGWCRFFIPVLALFYIASNVTIKEFSIIFSIFSLSILLLEIPTGVFADIIGKKNSLTLGYLFFLIEITLLAFTNGFWNFLLAKIISGFGVSLISGANSAILYDTLKKLKKENEHKKISGKQFMISNISSAFIFIIGGYLFTINPKLPAYTSIPFAILTLIISFFLIEPYKNSKKLTIKQSYQHLYQGLQYYSKHQLIIFISLFTFFFGAINHIFFSTSSHYYDIIQIPTAGIGIVAFVMSLLIALGNKKANTIEKILGEKKSFQLLTTTLIIILFGLSLTIKYFGLIFYALQAFIWGFYNITQNHYLNKHIPTSHRATMLSITNAFMNLGLVILFPLFGIIEETYTLKTTYTTLGIYGIIHIIILYILFKNKNIFAKK